MQRFYSSSTGCTYLQGINATMPDDAVPISDLIYLSTLARPMPDKLRGHDDAGLPILIDPPQASVAALAVQERQWRDGKLLTMSWLRDRHRDQLEIGSDTTLLSDQFTQLLSYMQALRDWPQSDLFPTAEHRPVPPEWIADQTH